MVVELSYYKIKRNNKKVLYNRVRAFLRDVSCLILKIITSTTIPKTDEQFQKWGGETVENQNPRCFCIDSVSLRVRMGKCGEKYKEIS